VRILHVTPHLPPDQAANALLPYHLGCWAASRGDEVRYVAHPPRQHAAHGRKTTAALPGAVTWVPARRRSRGLARAFRLPAAAAALAVARAAMPAIRWADLVHVHSNGLLAEIAALAAERAGKPVVLTIYGTEIWHYARRRWRPDLFTRAYRRAAHVTFYSHGLLTRATELGLGRRDATVIYPPVAAEFTYHDEQEQAAARAALGIRSRHLLVNVKRLHPLAGQRYLLEAMNEVIRTHPDTRLVICGTGPLAEELKMAARAWGVEGHVTFAGLLDNTVIARYDVAADAFVLPSLLEACPTVALEALACGTPVISSDNPGGMELRDIFGFDVTIVPRENPLPLAHAIVQLLDEKRRTRQATTDLIERDYRPAAVEAQYRAIYERVLAGAVPPNGDAAGV
jgi:glycosyltransferase involved in cell wall biosynthesis